MTLFALQVIWFLLIGVLFVGYTILDGFDLGVGIWHLFARKGDERGALIRSIGPVWDGNEVWLLTAGGALFAAFPHVYATVFSGLYLALMLVLFALIFRAVSIEFRGKIENPRWRTAWDAAFAIGSILPALLFGVAVGNILRGLPMDADKNFTGSFFGLLNPYALIVGVQGFVLFALHGALWIALKLDGTLSERAAVWAKRSWIAFFVLFIVTSLATMITLPGLVANFRNTPVLWLVPLATFASIIATGVFLYQGRIAHSFVGSSLTIAGIWGIIGASIFPALVPALDTPENTLTIANSSSSQLTLTVMLIIALIGVPIVLGYTVWVYRVFKGKVAVGEPSGY